MPRRARRAPKRRAAKRKGNRRGRARAPVKQMARIVETIEFNALQTNAVQSCVFNLNQFQRARTIATNFRWFKPTKVTWTIEPQFNVYQSGASFNSVPYLYQIMNRTQDAAGLDFSDILSQGAKPRKVTNAIKLSYKPNWCSPGLIVQNVLQGPSFGGYLNNVFMNGLQPQFGWLQAPNDLPAPPIGINPPQNQPLAYPTSSANSPVRVVPGSTIFNGHQWYIRQVTNASTQALFKFSCTVHWAFKDPKNTLALASDNIFADLSGANPEV